MLRRSEAPRYPASRRTTAHLRGPSEPGGSGSLAGSSGLEEVGTLASGPRSGSRARAAAAAPSQRRRPRRRSREARGAPLVPRAGARAAARASCPGREAGGLSCWSCGMGRLGAWAGSCTLSSKPCTLGLGSISQARILHPQSENCALIPRILDRIYATTSLAPDRLGPRFASWILRLPRRHTPTSPNTLQTEVFPPAPIRPRDWGQVDSISGRWVEGQELVLDVGFHSLQKATGRCQDPAFRHQRPMAGSGSGHHHLSLPGPGPWLQGFPAL